MKIILLKDVPGVGQKWDVKEVKAGYGRNYLIARGLAVLAAPKALKEAQLKKEREKQNKAVQENLLEKSLERLGGANIVIEKKANEKGHLFDGVGAEEIAEIIKENLKIEIPAEYIRLEKPIKEIGRHEIAVQKGLPAGKAGEREIKFQLEIKSLGSPASKKRLNADKR